MTAKIFLAVCIAVLSCFALLLSTPALLASKKAYTPAVKPLHHSVTYEHGRVLYPGLPRLEQTGQVW